ncbi:MAG: DUF3168 domain-containing protein [Pseudomonadota bacterium]
MSAVATLPADAEGDVLGAVMGVLRADLAVQALFGSPPRIFDDETQAPIFPNVRLERHETRDAGASCVPALEHRITLALASRWGGRAFAKHAMGQLRHVLETQGLSVPGQQIVLQQVLFTDVIRAADRRSFRGVLQLRIIAEEAA